MTELVDVIGLTSRDVCRATHLSYRRLDYWVCVTASSRRRSTRASARAACAAGPAPTSRSCARIGAVTFTVERHRADDHN